MKKYDVIVIGTGAGNIIIEEATKRGLKCAQIERGKFGGTCLTRGCIPTKAMVTVAETVRTIEEAKKIGVVADEIELNWKLISERVWKKIDESEELKAFYKSEKNVDVYEGTASFLSNKIVEIKAEGKEEKIEGDKIFINVGGKTKVHLFEGLEKTGYLTSESFFGDKYPEKPYEEIIIIGGGPIGTEFASTFAALGSKVKLVQRNIRLLPREDEDISEVVKAHMQHVGVEVHLNKVAVSIEKIGDKKHLVIRDRDTGKEETVVGDEILLASGIAPNTDLLSLENTDVDVDENGWIRTNEFLETTVDGIWAIGDVNGKQQFRHKANYEADIVAHNLFISKDENDLRWARYDLVPAVTFCYPEVAHIGITEKEAVDRGYSISVGINRYAMTAKGYAMGFDMNNKLDAFAKIVVDNESDNILGMHIVGPMASILIQPYLLSMNGGRQKISKINEDIEHRMSKKAREQNLEREMISGKLRTVRETMVPHPTLSEVSAWTYYHMEEIKK